MEQHRQILQTTFAGFGWNVPKLLAAVRTSRDLWFDEVSVVELASWARGRVALLGDASSCASLFGDGSTLAIVGAYTLAAALAEHPTDHEAAFRQYQTVHGRLVGPRLKALPVIAAFLVPRTRVGISVRNRFLAMAGPTYTAALRFGQVMRARSPALESL
jgi:2-polyprenyl-6-methoxyphenol hydroxylase-like FAD-dependent oxidoreductase